MAGYMTGVRDQGSGIRDQRSEIRRCRSEVVLDNHFLAVSWKALEVCLERHLITAKVGTKG